MIAISLKKFYSALIFVGICCAYSAVSASEPEAKEAPSAQEVAEAYIQAYEAQDFDRLREFYSDNAVFIDQTSFDMPQVQDKINWQGPDAIIAGIRKWGLSRGEYRIDRTFEASNIVVFDAEMDAVYKTPNGELIYRYPIITIVTVKDGKVIEHRDYTAFNNVSEVTEGTAEAQ